MKFHQSLLARYMLLIISAILFIPFIMPFLYIIIAYVISPLGEPPQRTTGDDIEEFWHEQVTAINSPESDMNTLQHVVAERFSEARVYWIDAEGYTRGIEPLPEGVPSQWSAGDTAAFMKKRTGYDADPFTVVSFFQNDPAQGMAIIEMERASLKISNQPLSGAYESLYLVLIIFVLVLFIIFSGLFFYRIRKRLLTLQRAMQTRDEDTGLPHVIRQGKKDEIGLLENSFNEMIFEIQTSQQREKEEETLRRSLIANISHDLRTPLTALRGQLFRLKKETHGENAQETITRMDDKISYIDALVDNLLSYALLSSNKYPFHPSSQDVSRRLRESIADWYPVFEKEGFHIEIILSEAPF
ncbi:HAMP domain-containing histidine kinase [Bacillaceae bacterium SIJ1]|uniref:sensor histidine kinase n=1 Tax=Litoribacterium kuwaitense TaxID=1398745 RepID=UPI0013EB9C46|nr:HAMP domain-containing sensor histidine kinase [Litoribacterium kuwaitense]NGP43861.1 HAMP domain-containing histidine kinase [Litoribacterium kuwaitense]